MSYWNYIYYLYSFIGLFVCIYIYIYDLILFSFRASVLRVAGSYVVRLKLIDQPENS
jgi:hypothetical protein